MENWGKNMEITLESAIELIDKIHDDILEGYMDAINADQPHDLETERILETLAYIDGVLTEILEARSAE